MTIYHNGCAFLEQVGYTFFVHLAGLFLYPLSFSLITYDSVVQVRLTRGPGVNRRRIWHPFFSFKFLFR